MKKVIGFLVLILGVLTGGQTVFAAGNRYVPEWQFAAQAGQPNFVVGVWRSGFASCQAADTAQLEHMHDEYPQKAPCEAATLCSPSSTTGFIRSYVEAGGSCQGLSILGPVCDTGMTLQYDPDIGVYCGKAEYSQRANVGKCKDCTPLVGNPIHVGIGNKLQEEIDYVGSGPFALRFVRFFNHLSQNAGSIGLGRGWRHNYDRRLLMSDPALGPVLVSAQRGDSKVIPFELSGGVYVGDPTFSERLERVSGGWRLINDDDEIELYDNNGVLLSITDRIGRTQTLSYSNGLLQSVTDPQGRALIFAYGPHKMGLTLTVPGGVIYQYAEDATDRLQTVTFPDGKTRIYGYTDPNSTQLSSITDENGAAYATFTYANGFAAETYHAGLAGIVQVDPFDASPTGQRHPQVTTYVTVPNYATRTYTFETRLGVAVNTAITGPACPGCGPAAQTYDTGGNRTSATDWNGNRTNYTWDTARRLETQRVEALTAAGATTQQTRTISTQWNTAFRLPEQIAEALRITTNVYDPDGTLCGAKGMLCSRTVQATSDANGSLGLSATPIGAVRTWTYTYDAMGRVLTINGPRTDISDVTTYTYYADNDADFGKRGNVATIANALGHTTNITAYNAHGQPLTIVDPNGLTTELTYDARQRLTSRTAGGEATTYDYDGAGQLKKVTLPDGSFLSYTYDDAHRLTRIQDNLGNRVDYTLDLQGNRTLEEVHDSSSALAQTKSRVISNVNRLFQEIGATGQTTQYAYDDQGNVTSVKDPLNHTTANAYDALNRVRQVTDPALGVTQYAYNGLNALTQVTDPRTLSTSYNLDGLGNLNQQVSPDTGTTTNTYDAAGNLLTQTDAKGQVTTYVYDALNRVTLITFQDGSKQSYAYDQGANALGRLTSIIETNPSNQTTSIIAYAYEQHGRVTSETRTIGGVQYVLGYSYDSAGRLSGLTYPSGRTVSYAFDALGRVSSVSTTKSAQTQSVVSNVTYHPFGGVNGFTLGNGQVYTRPYDHDGRVASYTLGPQGFTIGYDAASRIAFITETVNPSNTNTYGYDNLDRLTSAVLPTTPFAYAYDAVGNRTTKSVGSGSETYAYSSTSNRIATLTPASGPTRSFVFDNNGSTTNDGNNTYAYDTRGRMVQAVSLVGTTTYQINALGQRIRKTNSLDDRIFHYDTRGKLIGESDPGGTSWKREYIFLGDIPVGVIQ